MPSEQLFMHAALADDEQLAVYRYYHRLSSASRACHDTCMHGQTPSAGRAEYEPNRAAFS